jgi:hypothetical protein
LKRNKEFHNIPLLSVLETIGRDSTTTPRVFLSPPLQKKRKDPSSCEKKRRFFALDISPLSSYLNFFFPWGASHIGTLFCKNIQKSFFLTFKRSDICFL